MGLYIGLEWGLRWGQQLVWRKVIAALEEFRRSSSGG